MPSPYKVIFFSEIALSIILFIIPLFLEYTCPIPYTFDNLSVVAFKLNRDYYYLTTEIGKNFNDLEKIINSELYKIYKFTAKVKYKKWPNTSTMLDKRSFVGNSFLFKKVTGWKPKYSLRSAIKHYIHSKKITNK